MNLDSFPGREACCTYTTSAKPASDEPDTFVSTTLESEAIATGSVPAVVATGCLSC